MNRPSSGAIAESSRATFNPEISRTPVISSNLVMPSNPVYSGNPVISSNLVIPSNPVYSGALVPNTFWNPTQTYDQFPDLDIDIDKLQLQTLLALKIPDISVTRSTSSNHWSNS